VSLADHIETYRIHFGAEMPAERAQQVVDQWRAVTQPKVGNEPVELAAPFQRHYTKLGTGLPPNFCLALTAGEVVAFKFDPRHPAHPLIVTPKQVRKYVGRWPREAVRVTGVEPGKLAIGVELAVEDRSGPRIIPCRTPRLTVNPAAAVMITTLGGELPTP
jgi:hypothetical protein